MTEPQFPCLRCNSPDTAPYKFGENFILARYYKNARKCMDCDATFYDYERQSAPPIDFKSLIKAKYDELYTVVRGSGLRYDDKETK